MPSMDAGEENYGIYFYITRKGMEFHLADNAWWPRDDEDEAD